MKTLFLDESGDHNLITIDPQYPVFVLGGIIVDADYADGPLTDALDNFKREWFGRDDIVLHTADIARNRNGFESLQDARIRARFYDGLNELMRGLEYAVVACIIRKHPFRELHGMFAPDPYSYSFSILVERFCTDVVKTSGDGLIIAEGRDAALNLHLELEWANLKTGGTASHSPGIVTDRLRSLSIRSKKDNIAGLEIADLVVSPIGRNAIGRPGHEDWRIVEEKLLRNDSGEYQGYGLTLFP